MGNRLEALILKGIYSVNKHVKTQSDLYNVASSLIIGWREWVSLPELGLPAIKAKVDTGAKTSALHAFRIKRITHDGRDSVHFYIHPLQKNSTLVQECIAPILDQREVTDSGGHKELRYVIESRLSIGKFAYNIEMTLTARDDMRFRMLLGRQGIRPSMLVNASESFLLKRLKAKDLYAKQNT